MLTTGITKGNVLFIVACINGMETAIAWPRGYYYHEARLRYLGCKWTQRDARCLSNAQS